MYLVSVQLENFRRFEFAQIDFPDGVVGIIGNNGAGKSTLIEAVAWALYGNDASRTGKEQIKRLGSRAEDACRVILDFQMDGDNYRVVREISGKANTSDASVIVNKQIAARGNNPVNDFTRKCLDMDFRAFMTSFYARQKELNALSDFAPYQRKELLLRMLGIGDVDLALKNLRTDKRDLDTKLEVSRAQKEDMNLLKQEKEKINENLKNLENKLKDKKIGLEENQNLLKQREKEFNQQKEKLDLFNHLSNDIQVKDMERKGIEEQIAFQRNEREKLLYLKEENEKLKSGLADYDKTKEAHSEYEKRKERHSFYLFTKENLENLQRLIKQDEQAKKDKELRIKKQEKLEQQLSATQKEKSEIEKSLDKDRKLYAKLEAELDSIIRQREKLEEQLKNIEKLGANSICDRCLRPLGKDFPKIKLHIQKELEESDKKATDLKTKKNKVEIEGKDLKDKREKLEELIRSMEKEIRTILGDKTELEDIDKRQREKKEKEIVFLQTLSGLGRIDYDEKEYERIKAEFSEIEEKKKQFEFHQQEIKKIPQLEAVMAQLQERVKTTANQIIEIKRKLEELSFSSENYAEAEKGLEQAREEINQKKMALRETEHTIELIGKDLQAIEQRMSNTQKIAEEIKNWTIERTYLEKLESILDDFKISLIGRVRPTLSAYASGLLSELTENKYQDMELDENYDIYISEQGEKFPLERFSGGEKDLANLCLRLAISFMISESSAVGFSFIILDEIFGSQDISRKENIMNLLAKLKGRFRQIFLITHIEDVKDSVENLLYVVENENGTSQVIIQ